MSVSAARFASALVAVAGVLGGLVACGAGAADTAGAAGAVVAEFGPLAYVAERVAGPDREVIDLAPPGVEPHDLELAPSDVAAISRAGLVVYLADFAPAVDEAVAQNAADRGFDVATVVDLAAADDADHDHEGDDHDHGAIDPHFWLDPMLVADFATALGERLAELDSTHADAYAERAATLAGELADLDVELADGLAECRSDVIVTSHAAFHYFADRYGLEQVSVAGLEPESEPSGARIADVQALITEAGVTTIYFEPLASDEVVSSIAADLDVATAELDPLESIDTAAGADYFSIMRDNLGALRAGLGCT